MFLSPELTTVFQWMDPWRHPGGTQQAPRRHPGGTHLRVSPLNLNKHNYQLNIQYYQYSMLFMKDAKHLQNASKEYVTTQQTIHLRAPSSTMLSGLGACPGRPGDHPETSFWSIIVTFVDTCGDVFYMISKPLSCCHFAPTATHKTQFRRLLPTKFGTDWADLEKWQPWCCARRSIKIKLQRASSCIDSVIFMLTVPNQLFLWFQTYLYHILQSLGIHRGSMFHQNM